MYFTRRPTFLMILMIENNRKCYFLKLELAFLFFFSPRTLIVPEDCLAQLLS